MAGTRAGLREIRRRHLVARPGCQNTEHMNKGDCLFGFAVIYHVLISTNRIKEKY